MRFDVFSLLRCELCEFITHKNNDDTKISEKQVIFSNRLTYVWIWIAFLVGDAIVWNVDGSFRNWFVQVRKSVETLPCLKMKNKSHWFYHIFPSTHMNLTCLFYCIIGLIWMCSAGKVRRYSHVFHFALLYEWLQSPYVSLWQWNKHECK